MNRAATGSRQPLAEVLGVILPLRLTSRGLVDGATSTFIRLLV